MPVSAASRSRRLLCAVACRTGCREPLTYFEAISTTSSSAAYPISIFIKLYRRALFCVSPCLVAGDCIIEWYDTRSSRSPPWRIVLHRVCMLSRRVPMYRRKHSWPSGGVGRWTFLFSVLPHGASVVSAVPAIVLVASYACVLWYLRHVAGVVARVVVLAPTPGGAKDYVCRPGGLPIVFNAAVFCTWSCMLSVSVSLALARVSWCTCFTCTVRAREPLPGASEVDMLHPPSSQELSIGRPGGVEPLTSRKYSRDPSFPEAHCVPATVAWLLTVLMPVSAVSRSRRLLCAVASDGVQGATDLVVCWRRGTSDVHFSVYRPAS